MIDCVLFHNEWECLEIRVRELEGLVDQVLVVEGSTTFTGEPREVADLDRLMSISGLIKRIVVPLEGKPDAWAREHAQRNAILEGLDDCLPVDLVLISDVDEIPRRHAVEEAMQRVHQVGVVAFEHALFYYRLNWRDYEDSWCGTRLIRKDLIQVPQWLRAIRPRAHEGVMLESGWHFGWLGTPSQTLAKLQAFSHTELNTPEIANEAYLATCQRIGMTIHNGHLLTRVAVDESFPRLVRETPGRFAELIA